MRNPLTFRVESWVGSLFVLIFSSFLVGFFLIAMKNFNSDTEILNSSDAGLKFKIVSIQEKVLIDNWLTTNNAGISIEDVGYRYLIKKYPDKPWADR